MTSRWQFEFCAKFPHALCAWIVLGIVVCVYVCCAVYVSRLAALIHHRSGQCRTFQSCYRQRQVCE